jgi:hypothetical protein
MLCAVITGCQKDGLQYSRTDGELLERGFYFYRLPKGVAAEHQWQEGVHLWSYDRHCYETANPVVVVYEGSNGVTDFSVTIGPWDLAWNRNEPRHTIEFQTQWAMVQEAEYYVSGDYVKLRFTGAFDIPVQIGTTLPLTQALELISLLVYVGPPSETVTNPWDVSQCR